jgi:hypothetical protein
MIVGRTPAASKWVYAISKEKFEGPDRQILTM